MTRPSDKCIQTCGWFTDQDGDTIVHIISESNIPTGLPHHLRYTKLKVLHWDDNQKKCPICGEKAEKGESDG